MSPAGDVKIAAAYIRVSTEEQTEYSPDAQLVEIKRYAAAHGYLIPDELIFMDEGISGKNTGKRPQFNRMIGIAKQKPKPFAAILLWKFSRFARNREDSIVYKSMLRRQLGIDVLSVSEPLSDDKMSIIMEAMIEAMDEYYSINLAEEVKRGMTEKARRGGLQSTPSFGYGVTNNQLIPIPEEAALVRSIFARFTSGEGLCSIAKWLNELGVKTHRGSRFETRTVEYILCNPVYIGKLRWNPSGRTRRDFSNEHIILADSSHTPLVSQAQWDAAQLRMAALKAQWNYHSRPTTEHKDWISGLVRCASCGRTLVFVKPHYWKCNGYVHGSCTTTQHITDQRLKAMILSGMEYDLHSSAKIDCNILQQNPESLDECALLQAQQRQIAIKLSRLREAYLAGVEDLSGYRAAKSALEEQAETLSYRLNQLQTPQKTRKADALIKENIRQYLQVLKDPEADIQAKHNSMQSIVERCSFSKSDNTIVLTYRLLLPER